MSINDRPRLVLLSLLFSLALISAPFALSDPSASASLPSPSPRSASLESSSPPCPTAERTVVVPAVVNTPEGGLLAIRAQVAPGSGSVLSTVEPMVGAMTQESQAIAAKEAFRGLSFDPSRCDVRFYVIDANGAPSVDGPSAGMAMTTALRAALTNRTLRDDVSITGTIEPGGSAGLVGGLIDKAQASARGGMHVFITPGQELYENIILQRLGQEKNFSAVEVSDLNQSMAIATSAPGTPVEANYTLRNRPLPAGLAPLSQNDDDRRFSLVAHRLNALLRERLSAGGVFATPRYGAYFQTEVDHNEKLADMGYAYTAANNAFLSQVDAAFLSLPAHDPDVEGAANGVLDCVRRAPAPATTKENLEWVAGGDARIQWAMQKIEDVKKAQLEQTSSEEAYLSLRDVYYAQAWCDAGTQLLLIGQEVGGHTLNDEALATLANARVESERKALSQIPLESSDLDWHLMVANRSLNRHLWAAALYDAAYVQGSRAAALDELYRQNLSDGQAAPFSQIGSQPLSTLWGRTYYTQGMFLNASGGGDSADARRVWQMALAMDEQMGAALKGVGTDGGEVPPVLAADSIPASSPLLPSSLTSWFPALNLPDRILDALAALFLMAVCLALGMAIGRRIQKNAKSMNRRR